MTVCIAAICDDGKHIVVAADRMLTWPMLNMKAESHVVKIQDLVPGCVLMGSGPGTYVGGIRAMMAFDNSSKVEVLGNSAKRAYAEFRERVIDETYIRPTFGLAFSLSGSGPPSLPDHLEKHPATMAQVFGITGQYNIGVDLIVTGVDDAQTQIGWIGHPGTLQWLSDVGHAAVGAGGVHAMIRLTLLGQSPKTSLSTTLFNVYSAKRIAEIAPGVGSETDMAILSRQNTSWCDEELLKELGACLEVPPGQEPDLSRLKTKLPVSGGGDVNS